MELSLTSNHAKAARLATNALFFISGLSFSSWASRIPDVKEKLGLGDAALGTVLFAMPIGSLSALPLAGVIINYIGSRKVTLIAAIIYLLSMPFLGIASQGWQLAIALFIFGFGGDLLNISMNVQAVNVEKTMSKSIMSSFHAIFSIGFMIGAALGGILASQGISTVWHLSTVGILDIIVALFVYQYLIAQDFKSSEAQPLFALPDKSLMLLGVICFCGMLCEGAMADWSVLYFKQILGNASKYATSAFTAFSITMVIGRIIGDKTVAKLGLKKTLILNCSLVTIGMILALALPISWTVILGFSITGLGLSTVVPLIYSEAGHSKTMSAGVALAAISTVGISGFMIGPVMIGYIAEFTSLKIALFSLVILGGLGTILSTRIKN
ncbi:MFS transporter [Cellulophaga sp. BC115SP]|uniref:MFS transporter n=1 Tax=Cellulophaga sp. BC115SP TaxID=2683263 RepID=UPI0014124639|nr:MFS transporter [Cellulophaga sp. BC115SP]NBB30473.1 MFS transporter [Cellulophaga sp. BC115SP]